MLYVCNRYADASELYYDTLFIIYIALLNINMFNFLLTQVIKVESQRSKDDIHVEESDISPPIKSKGKEKIEGDKKNVNNTTMNEDNHNTVDKISNLIEPPRDKDGKIKYQCMFFNTGLYKKGEHPSTARRQIIFFIVIIFVLILRIGVNSVGSPSG